MGRGKKDSDSSEDDRKKKHKKKGKKGKKEKKPKDIPGHVKNRREAVQRTTKEMKYAPQLAYRFVHGDPLGRTDPFRLEIDGSGYLTPQDAKNVEAYKAARQQMADLQKEKIHAKRMGIEFRREDDLRNATARYDEAFEKFNNADKVELKLSEADWFNEVTGLRARRAQRKREMTEANRRRQEAIEDWHHARHIDPLRQDAEDAEGFTRDIDRAFRRQHELGAHAQQAADDALNYQINISRAQYHAEELHLPDGLPVTSFVKRQPRYGGEYYIEGADGWNHMAHGREVVAGRPNHFGTDKPQWFHAVDRGATDRGPPRRGGSDSDYSEWESTPPPKPRPEFPGEDAVEKVVAEGGHFTFGRGKDYVISRARPATGTVFGASAGTGFGGHFNPTARKNTGGQQTGGMLDTGTPQANFQPAQPNPPAGQETAGGSGWLSWEESAPPPEPEPEPEPRGQGIGGGFQMAVVVPEPPLRIAGPDQVATRGSSYIPQDGPLFEDVVKKSIEDREKRRAERKMEWRDSRAVKTVEPEKGREKRWLNPNDPDGTKAKIVTRKDEPAFVRLTAYPGEEPNRDPEDVNYRAPRGSEVDGWGPKEATRGADGKLHLPPIPAFAGYETEDERVRRMAKDDPDFEISDLDEPEVQPLAAVVKTEAARPWGTTHPNGPPMGVMPAREAMERDRRFREYKEEQLWKEEKKKEEEKRQQDKERAREEEYKRNPEMRATRRDEDKAKTFGITVAEAVLEREADARVDKMSDRELERKATQEEMVYAREHQCSIAGVVRQRLKGFVKGTYVRTYGRK